MNGDFDDDNESVDSMSDLFPEMFDLIEKDQQDENESMQVCSDEINSDKKSIKRKLDTKVNRNIFIIFKNLIYKF
jgi:hypothetical protein